jgi:FlaA1/EpsC-like NDP-sugar epimerase
MPFSAETAGRPAAARIPAPRRLIAGAGDAGRTLLREILRRCARRHQVVGFLDDDPRKHGRRICGVPVLGPIEDLPRQARALAIAEVLIAMPSASPQRVARIFELSRGGGWSVRIVPSLAELIEGPISLSSQLRPLRLEDLLPRPPLQIDQGAVESCVRGRSVLVSGAGGSIGAELCRQLTRFGPARLVLVERAENELFHVERELQRLLPGSAVRACLADVCDRRRLAEIFKQERPAVVCHATAHKHVSMVEANPAEGVRNNVLGTQVIAELALLWRAGRFVLISTDKAVNPASVMGCSKRAAELVVQGLSGRGLTRFITVRFGNVLGSRGSVVPIFQEQVARGGPLTITHPQASRYFMTIPEAAQLVLAAGASASDGQTLILEMGRPIRILDLAHQILALHGTTPADIGIVFTGLRPGEKLTEQLVADNETLGPAVHPHIRVCLGPPLDAGEGAAGARRLSRLLALAESGASPAAIRAALMDLVQEYRPPGCPAPPSAGRGDALVCNGTAARRRETAAHRLPPGAAIR